MSSTTIVTTWSDLVSALVTDMRSNTSQTATTNTAKRYIDTGHHELYIGHGEKFHWAERTAYLKTHAEYSTGTLTATIGSGTLTGSSTAWNTNNDHGVKNARAGGKMVIDGTSTVYEVQSVAGDTSMVVSPEWIGETESSLTYRYFEDEYDLASDFMKPMDAQAFDVDGTIRFLGRTRFRQMNPRNRTTSTVLHTAIIQDRAPSGNTTPRRRIRFAPPPSNVQIVHYAYVTKNIVVASDGTAKASFTDDADEPIMPLKYRNLILLAAKIVWYRELKDDQRRLECQAELAVKTDGMIGDQDVGAQKLRMRSPRARYKARAKNPYRGGGRYDVNGRWDNFEW